MTPHDLQSELATQTAHLSMERPAAEILARGERLRRRRRAVLAGSAATVVAVSLLGASVLTPPGSSPMAPPTAYAAWGPAMVNLDPGDDEAVRARCSRDLGDVGLDLRGASPVAADTRDLQTVAVYVVDGRYGFCALNGPVGRLQPRASVVGRLGELPAGRPLVPVASTFAQAGGPGSPTTDGAGALRVSPAVDRVTVQVAGQVFDAALGGGFAMFWLPDRLSEAQVDAATATAYDADGEVLVQAALT